MYKMYHCCFVCVLGNTELMKSRADTNRMQESLKYKCKNNKYKVIYY